MARKKLKKALRKLEKLKKRLKLVQLSAPAAKPALVSPLAPKGGFPSLPVIAGVRFATAAAGVKYKDRTDVMLVELAEGTTIAGAFTRSATRAAPVLDCQSKLGQPATGGAAILVNAGNANAFTGQSGQTSVQAISSEVARVMGIDQNRVFTSSTGVIGQPLPHERITAKLEELKTNLAADKIADAAAAIMTTDTFPKGAGVEYEADGGTIRIAGFAKGSGMIAPDMATMLVYIVTDAKVAQKTLQAMVNKSVDATFNCITVDSDTSTSDSLIVAATGAGHAAEVGDLRSASGKAFHAALQGVMLDLAHQVVRDGEGATKFVEVNVTGAAGDGDARKVAMAIANSPLVKTAIAGEDPNWGRVVMAVGKSGARADRDTLSISLGDILVAEKGQVSPNYTEDAGASYMKRQDLVISVDLGVGEGKSVVWTCDLTNRYIEINADYRS
ncbi:MAG: bifunctional glutamate N-acetyltransferase/amino-acid acetyltransferase ArgJ [Paracoccaceae bacterium]